MRTSVLIALLLASSTLGFAKPTSAERSAERATEKELVKLARYASKGYDFAAARAELELGLLIYPESKKLQKALASLERAAAKKQGKTPKASVVEALPDKRSEAHADVALALAKAALSTEEEAPERYARYVALIQSHLPVQAALDELDLVYFAPYYRWVSRSEAALLDAGGERHDGKNLDADAVAALDQQHASWSNPWVISDEIHEVRTTVPLRQAKQILAYVGAYREYFLGRFGSSWDLQEPTGKLPVIVTATQADMQEQMTKATRGMANSGGVQGAAFYMQTNSKLNPCFVTLEPKDASGLTFQIDDFEQLQIPLAHEVTHQIVFEYSKHDYDATRQVEHHFWAVEAIANYMGYHAFDGKEWTLTHPRTIPMGHGMIEGPFAYCANHVESLPALEDFMGLSHQQFMSVNNYHVAATLAYFLLEGEDGKYREQFIDLLQTVHQVKDRRDSFEASFPGVDRAALQAEWLRFVREIQIDG